MFHLLKLAESYLNTSISILYTYIHIWSIRILAGWLFDWLATMHCDRLLFVSGHKSNSFHNTDDFFPFFPHLSNLYVIYTFCPALYPLSQIPSMHYYFILSVQFLSPSLGCNGCTIPCVCVCATYHLSDGDANTILGWEFYRLAKRKR